MQYKDMGNRIKLRRKELQIKQATLAEALEISNNHMSAIENGREKPSLDIFVQICHLLNVTPDYLLLGNMNAYNIPKDISEKLRLCSQADIELAKDFIELLVKRNENCNTMDYKNGRVKKRKFFHASLFLLGENHALP